jgi:hypothetical protein
MKSFNDPRITVVKMKGATLELWWKTGADEGEGLFIGTRLNSRLKNSPKFKDIYTFWDVIIKMI